jgi:predicted DNA-binding protein (MmcQ/YjbR family)
MLPATTYVIQWGGAHVWKVGGKVFAVGGLGAVETCFTFKVSDLAYEMLKQLPGLRPAPYLASRGLKWIQHFAKPGLSDAEIRSYIRQSYQMVGQSFTKRTRIKLGLEP